MTMAMYTDAAMVAVEDLRRELAHVSEQCRTAHAMAMNWRQRALTAEMRLRRLERKYDRLKKRKGLEHAPDPMDEGELADATVPQSAMPAVV